MNRVAIAFSAIAAALGGMYAVAVEGQAPELPLDEVKPLVARMRTNTRLLARQIAAAVVLNR
ncbi:hypothetical protein ASG37_01015 [Sphingomonas sp. Leaf407]|uniref:hypothetical protein n=1 Tax=unclassified Sphingomonas TaxID=196159 RepID=UPI0006FF8737|nr:MULTISPECIES: hypothetical protein [unclassified Sphingomonas]KQN40422.1 hypothetical protein ASE97_01045 [Sphingomonas sp. Leaf42]KQT29776.1 hypothetical protein ASG37_01015 [Sphingomonas sp. Leaf407]